MALVTAPTFAFTSYDWELDRPAQVNSSAYSGKSAVVANPWHGKWRAKATLRTEQGEANFRPVRAFLASLKGQVNTFLLPATEGAQVTSLDLNFATGTYSVTGVSYGSLASIPGYSYTRAGSITVLDSDNSFDTFSANVPPINGYGLHNYGALTNSLLQSQALDNASWSKNATTVTADAVAAPDGTTTADKLAATAVTNWHWAQQNSAIVAGAFTYVAFAKAAEETKVTLADVNIATKCVFDLSAVTAAISGTDAAVTLSNGRITDLGGGWFQCVVKVVATATRNAALFLRDGVSYAGTAGNGAYFWQEQLLAGDIADGGPIIATTTASASTSAPTLSVSYPNGSYTAIYTFDDNSTQAVATTVSGGLFTLATHPATLNRARVKRVTVGAAVTASTGAAQGATSITLNANMGLTAGMLVSVTLPSGNIQLLVLTQNQTSTPITFEPPLREAISTGAAVEVANPVCQVALTTSSVGWSVGQWRRYGISFDVEERF